ncbi:ankyrin repeat-containing domain protein [Trichophaea hybrida]|nr:ankyrin repeat-containing domain protein [Trichophaea hybrida]
MSLLSLPIELLLLICSFFDHLSSIYSLVRTCKHLQFMLTDALYKKGSKIIFSKDGATALHRCCRLNCGLLPTHSLLLAGSAPLIDLKSEPRSQIPSTTPLHHALERINMEVVELLLTFGSDPSKISRVEKIAKTCCSRHFLGINIFEHKDDLAYRPHFLRAIASGKLEVADLLMKKVMIELSFTDKRGFTPLHYAVKHGRTEIVKNLLSSPRININARDRHLRTPLHIAAEAGRVEIVKVLLSRGALSMFWDKDGMTPLHRAIVAKEWSVVEVMVRKWGVNVTLKDRRGMTAVERARVVGLGEDSMMMKLLMRAPGDPKMLRRRVSAPVVVMGGAKKGEKRRFTTGGVQTAAV